MRNEKRQFAERIGTRIRAERIRKGWQKSYLFAEVAHISPRTLYSIEEGRRTPGSYTLLKICEALGVSISDVINEAKVSARID